MIGHAIVLNTSAEPWRLDDRLHRLGSSKGGILTCPHVGITGHDIKMIGGALVPLKSGDQEILHELRFLRDLLPLPGGENNFKCDSRGKRPLPLLVKHHFYPHHGYHRGPSQKTIANVRGVEGTGRFYTKNSRTWCSAIPRCECDLMGGLFKKMTELASVSPPSWSGTSGIITCSTA